MHAGFNLPAKVNVTARSYKNCCGGAAYKIAAVREFCRLREMMYDFHVDGKIAMEDFTTATLIINNGKVCGGEMYLNPFSMINDGMIDCVFDPTKATFRKLSKQLDQAAKQGGI